MERRPFAYTVLPVCIILVAAALCAGITATNATYAKTNKLPFVSQGVLDLSSYSDYSSFIPLEGEWEFAWNAWPISDNTLTKTIDWETIQIPGTWPDPSVLSRIYPKPGYATYRLKIINCSKDLNYRISVLQCFTPYRVFMNGELVLEDGYLDKDTRKLENRSPLLYKSLDWHQGASCEVIVEVAARHTGGFYAPPILKTARSYYVGQAGSIYQQSLLLGGIVMAIIILMLLVAFKDSAFSPKYLLLTAILLGFLVFLRSDLIDLKVFKLVGAHFEAVVVLINLMLSLLPLCSLLSLRSLVKLPLSKRAYRIVIWSSVALCLHALFGIACIGPYSVIPSVVLVTTLLLYLSAELIRAWKNQQQEGLFLASAFFILALSIIFDAAYHAGFFILNLMFLLGSGVSIFLVMMFSVYIKRNVEFQKEALEAEYLRFQLRESKVALMISQIGPHFIYNTLTAIMALIKTDQESAARALGNFSRYLRWNMSAVDKVSLIPFVKEFEHIKTYLEIEQTLFGDRVAVVYDIQSTAFDVPQLSIQPIVENAIKHGICKRIEGGCVRIHTHENEQAHFIEVVDDGVGFDSALLKDIGTKSIGLRNALFRLKEEVGATVEIKSEPDKGTHVCIRIRKNGESMRATSMSRKITQW